MCFLTSFYFKASSLKMTHYDAHGNFTICFPILFHLRPCLFKEAFITSPHNRKKRCVTASPLQEFQSRFHYTFRGLLILESKTYANEAAAWFYKARNFKRLPLSFSLTLEFSKAVCYRHHYEYRTLVFTSHHLKT